MTQNFKRPRYKQVKGISVSRGKLRISVPRKLFNGQQRYIHTGLDDTRENWGIAKGLQDQMNADIAYHCFDFSLKRYKPQSVQQPTLKHGLTFLELLQRYTEAKKPLVSLGTIQTEYQSAIRCLEESPFAQAVIDSEFNGVSFLNWIAENRPTKRAKRLMVHFNASLKWAIESGILSLNTSPLEDLSKRIKQRSKSWKINVFSKQEFDQIIEGFKSHPRGRFYVNYLLFCFYTGCRPSEAIGLTWDDVSPDLSQVTFSHAVISAPGGLIDKPGLKSQDQRIIHCSQQLRQVLQSAKESPVNHLVFPNPKGKWISKDIFRAIWKEILEAAGIPYRKPYQMRHTFISQCLEQGIGAKDTAKLAGNTPAVIYKHYAENTKPIQIPER